MKIQPVDSLASLSPGPSCIDPRYFLKIKIRGHTVLGLIDTGATRSYLGKSFAPLLRNSLIPTNSTVIVANNAVERVAGEANIRLRVGKAQRTLPLRLVNSLSQDCILGMDFLQLFGLEIDFSDNTWTTPDLVEPQNFDFSEYLEDEAQVVGESAGLAETSTEQRDEIARLVQRLVREPSKTLSATNLTTHKIDVEGHAPIRQNPRWYSSKVLDSAHKILDELLDLDVIEPCQSP